MNRLNTASALIAAAGLAVCAAGQTDIYWNIGSGSWGDLFNWNPNNVPNTYSENARILAPSGAVVTLDINPGINLLEVGPGMTLDMPHGKVILLGTNLVNDGLINVNLSAGTLNSYVQFNTTSSISGSGTLRLGGDGDDSALYTGGGEVVTNGVGHTIDGAGNIHAGLLNEGTVTAMDTGFGSTLALLGAGKTNHSVIEADPGAVLVVTGTTLTQNATGVVRANDGGTVRFDGNQTIIGGTLDAEPGGMLIRSASAVTTLQGVTLADTLEVQGGGVVHVNGPVFNCPGTLSLNNSTNTLNAYVQILTDCTATGGGSIFLAGGDGGNSADSAVYTSGGTTLTIDPAFSLGGSGEIHAAIVNNGLIRAFPSANGDGRLHLLGSGKTNNAQIVGDTGGVVQITSITVSQGANGVIRADGGGVEFAGNPVVVGGTIDAVNGGTVSRLPSGTLYLTDVTLDGDLSVLPGGVVYFTGSTIENNATFYVNNSSSSLNAYVQSDTDCTLSGPGSLFLAGSGNDSALYTSGGSTLTLASGATIEGSGQIHAAMVNRGLIRTRTGPDADGRLVLLGGAKTNEADIVAEPGGVIEFSSVSVTQTGAGRVLADGGRVEFRGNPTLNGGTLDTMNGGVLSREASGTLYLLNATLESDFYIQPGGVVLYTGDTFENNGSVIVNDTSNTLNAWLQFDTNCTVSGTGSVHLAGSLDDSQLLTSGGATVTFGPDTSVTGSGDVHAALVNNGTFRAFPGGDGDGRLRLLGSAKTNNAAMIAETGGVLDFNSVGVTQGPSGVLLADGGSIEFNGNPSIAGGTLDTANGGRIYRTSGGTLYLGDTTLAGEFEILPGGVALLTGTSLVNDGTVYVNDTTNTLNGYFQFNTLGTVSGTGRFVLGGGADDSQIICSGGATGTFGPGQTIEGDGQLHGTFFVGGTLSPGLPIGDIGGSGSLDLAGSALVDIEAAGDPGAHDRVARSGGVDLGGTLRFRFTGPVPTVFPAVYPVVSASTLTGEFDTLDLPAPVQPGSAVYVGYDATTAYVAFTCLSDNAPPYGVLDLADVTGFVNAFLAQQGPADLAAPFGVWDLADVLAFVSTFTAGCP